MSEYAIQYGDIRHPVIPGDVTNRKEWRVICLSQCDSSGLPKVIADRLTYAEAQQLYDTLIDDDKGRE